MHPRHAGKSGVVNEPEEAPANLQGRETHGETAWRPQRAQGTRRPIALPSRANERWSLGFVSDALTDGHRFRILAVVDDFTREDMALVADTSLSGLQLTRELNTVIASRGKPRTIVSDNGNEMTSMAVLAWCHEAIVDWHQIAPDKPVKNGFVESFNGRFRDE